ncbi:type II toxin-antitoxin system Phd/YefM family antitoxin [Streptomyces sp. NBC_01387]|uniref:type II toxin-antitoxin system Phd/YefM family antitoxin n=1 Tax=unclassified Streptomyces TaxID=2593676 RepID=UPI002025679C|nr:MULTISPECIES: type II toxin-antitoxin system Phd/YefM family antitoxin [unclassified Streptomyces]MCX4551475.1 type II toxin-antitoxin system Phd/YefM family antitoxin [Streptomyces sp. NBC_01500]WSC22862.1 type II toxin-antitoxin system Phd/YefM family antitoxin [Streptomyces sp. NBC_01766]WSV56773.1 type II toxin-antitoxin system Phd/YefM family antitoxin [Streptomyces sp. NBC_01014]
MDESVSVREARAQLARILDAAQEGTPTVISRAGVPVAAVVPFEAYSALEDAADQLLAREAVQHLGEPTVGMAEVLADIFGSAEGAA